MPNLSQDNAMGFASNRSSSAMFPFDCRSVRRPAQVRKGRNMQKRKRLLQQTGFHAFLFALFLLALIWPILSIPGHESLLGFFTYLFSIWAVMIVLLVMMNRSLGRDESENADEVLKK
jgi:hypothetical protein